MCLQLEEVCPACCGSTGIRYRYVNHGPEDACQIIDEGQVFPPRSRLMDFECPRDRCSFSEVARRDNEAKFAAAYKQSIDHTARDDVPPSVANTSPDTSVASTGAATASQPPTPATAAPSEAMPSENSIKENQLFFILPTFVPAEIQSLMEKIDTQLEALAMKESEYDVDIWGQAPLVWLPEEDKVVNILRHFFTNEHIESVCIHNIFTSCYWLLK